MKKIVIIFVIILFACEKDNLFCWNCVITDRVKVNNELHIISFHIKKCNMTELEIYQYEKDGYKKTISDSLIIETTKKCIKITN